MNNKPWYKQWTIQGSIPVINGVPVLEATYKQFHGKSYKSKIEKYFYGEKYYRSICDKVLGNNGCLELRSMNYYSKCGNEIDWNVITR